MANPEHLRRLAQRGPAWNQWRQQDRDIKPEVSGADLSHADLVQANLVRVDLAQANLCGADLTNADLFRANLARTDLAKSYRSKARLLKTVFSDTNLTAVQGLETGRHAVPSPIDHRTLANPGHYPSSFSMAAGYQTR